MENQPGNGYTSPFGNEHGATLSGPTSDGHDFTADPSNGPTSGGHDFTADPASHAPLTGGHDFTGDNRPQLPEGRDTDINPDSIPPGGTSPYVTSVDKSDHVPFKIFGGTPSMGGLPSGGEF